MKNKRVFSPYLFALIIICLAFPFVTVSCAGEKICSLSGYELAFGTQVQDQKVDGSFAAIMLLILALIGIGLYFWKNINANFAASAVGALGVIFAFVLKSGIESKVANEAQGAVINYKVGFILIFILYIAAACYNLYLYIAQKQAGPPN